MGTMVGRANITERPPGRVALVRLVVAVALGVAAALAWSAPAHAHTELVGSTPAADEAVGLSADRLVLTFTDALLPDASAVIVRGPDGVDAVRGEPRIDGNVLSVALDLEETGRHSVTYRVVGDDGHVVAGKLSFRVVAAAGSGSAQDAPVAAAVAEPTTSPASVAPPASTPLLPWVLGAATLVLILLALRSFSTRRQAATAKADLDVPDGR